MKKKYFISLVLFLITKMVFAQEPFLGEIRLFSGTFAPRGWALCDGQLMSINENPALFSILGTTYGGNGTTTFALPDLRGRVAVGQGSYNVLGQKGGAVTVAITEANMPTHQHAVPLIISSDNGALNVPSAGNKIAKPMLMVNNIPRTALGFNTNVPNIPLAGTTTSSSGGSSPIMTQQPSLGMVYIIAFQGVFPSRN